MRRGEILSLGAPALRETLQPECFPRGSYCPTRVVHDPSADLEVSLCIDGSDLAELLARIDAVDPRSQFQRGAGFVIGLSYSLEPVRGQVRRVLAHGGARVDGLTVVLRPSSVGGMPADLELSAPAGERLDRGGRWRSATAGAASCGCAGGSRRVATPSSRSPSLD